MRSKFSYKELLSDLNKVKQKKFSFGNDQVDQVDQKEIDRKKIEELTKKVDELVKKNNTVVNSLDDKFKTLPPKKKSLIKKYLVKILVAIGYKIGDLIDFSFKQLLALVIQHFGKLVLAAITIRYGLKIQSSINKKVNDVGDRFEKKNKF